MQLELLKQILLGADVYRELALGPIYLVIRAKAAYCQSRWLLQRKNLTHPSHWPSIWASDNMGGDNAADAQQNESSKRNSRKQKFWDWR